MLRCVYVLKNIFNKFLTQIITNAILDVTETTTSEGERLLWFKEEKRSYIENDFPPNL